MANSAKDTFQGCLIFVVLMVVGGWWLLSGDDDPNTAQPAARPTSFSSPEEELDYDVTEALGFINRSDVSDRVTIQWSEDDGELTIEFAGNDNFTNSMIVNRLLNDTLAIAKACRESSMPFKNLNIGGTLPLQDKFGNVSEGRVSLVCFSRQTLSQMNFGNLRPDDVERVADSYYVSPQLAD